jgi:hypothetical protein
MIFTLALKMIVDAAFEQVGNPASTNWCIAVHFCDYLFYSAACMHISFIMSEKKILPLFIMMHRVFYRWLFNLAGIIYVIYAFIELSYINVLFKDYNVAMFDGNYALSHSLLTGLSIAVYFGVKKIKTINKILTYV